MFKKLTALAMAAFLLAAFIPVASVLMPSEAYANSYNKPPPVKKDTPKAKPAKKSIKKDAIRKGGVSGISSNKKNNGLKKANKNIKKSYQDKNKSVTLSKKTSVRLGSLKNNTEISKKITDKLPKKIHHDSQGKHIVGHKNYIAGRSPLANGIDAQKLLDGVHGGLYPIIRITARGQPIVDFRKTIGHFEGKMTQFGIIHHGKNGAHIVPANPIQF